MTAKVLTVPGCDKAIKKVYLAGRITREPNYLEIFGQAAFELRKMGLEVMNPADTDNQSADKDRGYYMRIDLDYVVNAADAVVVLSNWKNSEGAKTEVRVAIECGKPVLNFDTLTPITEKVHVVVDSAD